MELNRDQVIYCLEQDIESGCGMYREVDVTDLKRALALIKELTEENEELTSNLVKQCAENVMLYGENKRLSKALNTDISIVRVSRGSGKTAHLREVGRIKVDAIRAATAREMAKRLKGCREKVDGLTFRLVSFDTIDKVKEEMINENI